MIFFSSFFSVLLTGFKRVWLSKNTQKKWCHVSLSTNQDLAMFYQNLMSLLGCLFTLSVKSDQSTSTQVSHMGDKQEGALSHPMTPHWSVSMVIEIWWTAEFWVRSEGRPNCSFPQCSTLTLIISFSLTNYISFFSHHSSSSIDKWKLYPASLLINWQWLFSQTDQLQHGAGLSCIISPTFN